MFRVIAQHRPALLLDEADTILRDNPNLCRIINAGNKLGGSVLRVGSGSPCNAAAGRKQSARLTTRPARWASGYVARRHAG